MAHHYIQCTCTPQLWLKLTFLWSSKDSTDSTGNSSTTTPPSVYYVTIPHWLLATVQYETVFNVCSGLQIQKSADIWKKYIRAETVNSL